MEIENGRTVRIKYNCKFQDGRPCTSGNNDMLQFKVGAGMIPPSLEAALIGMSPGQHRVIRVPSSELALFPFSAAQKVHLQTPPGVAYDFGPGEGGDVAESIPPGKIKSLGRDVNFEIEVLNVE